MSKKSRSATAFDPRPRAAMLVRVASAADGTGSAGTALDDMLGKVQALAVASWPDLLRPGDSACRTYANVGAELECGRASGTALPDPAIEIPTAAWDAVVVPAAAMPETDVQAVILAGIPIIKADPHNRARFDVLVGRFDELGLVGPETLGGDSAATAQLLAQVVFGPPRAARETARLREFLAEGAPRRSRRFEYDAILRLIGPRAKPPGKPMPDMWRAAAAEAGRQGFDAAAELETVRAAHDYADAHARFYGQKWRSAVVARSFLLLLPNIVSGAVGALAPQLTIITIPVQVLTTIGIFVDRRFSIRGRWQQKWLEYRALAERLRSLRFLRLAGVASSHGDAMPPSGWVDWYAARLERSLGAPFRAPKDAAGIIDHLVEVEIRDQILYHREAVRRFCAMDIKLRLVSRVMLGVSIVLGTILFGIGLARSGVEGIPWPALTSLGLTFAPTIVTGLTAFRSEFDLVRLAERSARTVVGLSRLAQAARARAPTPQLVRQVAHKAAEIMTDEVSRWQLTLETRAARLKRH